LNNIRFTCFPFKLSKFIFKPLEFTYTEWHTVIVQTQTMKNPESQ